MFLFPSLDKYKGTWAEGKFHGVGTMEMADGSKYIGEWAKGTRKGKHNAKEKEREVTQHQAFRRAKKKSKSTNFQKRIRESRLFERGCF